MNSDFQHKTFVFLERLWLVGAILGLACTVFFLITKDNDSALFFLLFFVMSAVIYLLRKRQRKRHEGQLEALKNKDLSNPKAK